MKEQSKPNPLRTIVAVAGITLLGLCAKDITNLGGRACAYVGKQFQPAADIATNVFRDVTKERPNTLYNSTTNEVAILKGMLAIGDPNANTLAERRAYEFYRANLGDSLRRNLVDSPMPQDKSFLDAINYIGVLAGRKQ